MDLGQFIRARPNLRVFAVPLSGDVKDDVMLALKTAWVVIKRRLIKSPKDSELHRCHCFLPLLASSSAVWD